jgi:hypothetical protein
MEPAVPDHNRHDCGNGDDERSLTHQPREFRRHNCHLLSALEPEVLKGLGGAPVQRGGATIVAATLCQVALGDPCRGLMGP